MSAYDNIVGGKLKLKGKALDVKAGISKKKKKKQQQQQQQQQQLTTIVTEDVGGSLEAVADPHKEEVDDSNKSSGEKIAAPHDVNLTPAERRYIEQREQLDVKRLAKEANKSHRDRIQDFNQYLANMSEHYDIPKVGPG